MGMRCPLEKPNIRRVQVPSPRCGDKPAIIHLLGGCITELCLMSLLALQGRDHLRFVEESSISVQEETVGPRICLLGNLHPSHTLFSWGELDDRCLSMAQPARHYGVTPMAPADKRDMDTVVQHCESNLQFEMDCSLAHACLARLQKMRGSTLAPHKFTVRPASFELFSLSSCEYEVQAFRGFARTRDGHPTWHADSESLVSNNLYPIASRATRGRSKNWCVLGPYPCHSHHDAWCLWRLARSCGWMLWTTTTTESAADGVWLWSSGWLCATWGPFVSARCSGGWKDNKVQNTCRREIGGVLFFAGLPIFFRQIHGVQTSPAITIKKFRRRSGGFQGMLLETSTRNA